MNQKCSAITSKKTNCARNACNNSEFCTQHKKIYELSKPIKDLDLKLIPQTQQIEIQNNTSTQPQQNNSTQTQTQIDNCNICNEKFTIAMDINDRILRSECNHYYHESCAKKIKTHDCIFCLEKTPEISNSNDNPITNPITNIIADGNNNAQENSCGECCICFDNFCADKQAVINCGHLICKTCFVQLRSPFCPICRADLKSSDKTITKSIAKMNRRLRDDKERTNTRLTQQFLEQEAAAVRRERLIEEQWTEVCSYSVEVMLSLSDLRKEDIALACFGILRHRFANYDVELLTMCMENSFQLLNL